MGDMSAGADRSRPEPTGYPPAPPLRGLPRGAVDRGALSRRLDQEFQLVYQVPGELVEVWHQLPAGEQPEGQLPQVPEDRDVESLPVGDYRHGVVREELGSAHVHGNVRPR